MIGKTFGDYEIIEKRGEGIHHLCFEVEDLAEAAAYLRKKGYTPLWEHPKVGAGGKPVHFLRPKETGGVLIELNQSLHPVQDQ